MKQVLKIYCNIFNDEEETVDLILNYLGYSLTGETSEQIGLFLYGPNAGNGKSKSLEIMKKCFPIYVKELNLDFFNKNYGKKHKILAELLLIRLSWISELDFDTLCTKSMKRYVDGGLWEGIEKMFGTTLAIVLLAKLIICTNHLPNF